MTFQSPFVAVAVCASDVLVDPLDRVADLGVHFGRRENELVDRNLYRLRLRRDGQRPTAQSNAARTIRLGVMAEFLLT